eukprot:CAMPEP_0184370730 /NCGR_PEP_ID=MMETSP1089-20130417/162993_1 /TAXON_ID=38269 ORGANISM="Gloeochaete wittrockiana, Strain SAG46.84" /NCGR_SAMPLE_ID=MMETSP1089 /ASSEMBLY_ACC=CAM_ASM_000445 /LENGTH=346 /DNA_ID=CAMNT_0026713383 /DNA_START=16 /DNA_END=1053 /DNA_ORIENTATION=-
MGFARLAKILAGLMLSAFLVYLMATLRDRHAVFQSFSEAECLVHFEQSLANAKQAKFDDAETRASECPVVSCIDDVASLTNERVSERFPSSFVNDVSAYTKELIRSKILPIESLFADRDFRPEWGMVEHAGAGDRRFLLPYLLGDRVDTKRFARRVYIDLGASHWNTSLKWHVDNNPVVFDEYHLFEAKFKTELPKSDVLGKTILSAPARKRRHLPQQKGGAQKVGESMRTRTFAHHAYVGLEDNPSTDPPTINITRYLYDVVRITEKDTFVTVKCDIEGSEWQIIQSWDKDHTLDYIHEMFVEIHYGDSRRLHSLGWNKYQPYKRQDAIDMYTRLRDQGVFTHAW